jgi:CubicO group peptidase (beta-lactamase class C family)
MRSLIRGLTAVVLLTAPPLVHAQSRPVSAAPAARGFARDRLERIDRFLQQAVDENRIAGAVGLVLRDGQVVYERAVGWSDREAGRRMTADAMFRIASQTKALTSVVIMTLVEEGKMALTDPVSRYIPAYARTTVATRTDTGRAIVPARRPIRIVDLLTHTAGISYGTDPLVAPLYAAQGLGTAAGYGYYTADKDEPICATMERLASVPFVGQPGESWIYGYGTDILGCVAERVGGQPLDVLIRERITRPLGMRDTHFFVPRDQRDRLVAVYMTDSTGAARRAVEGARGQGHYVDGPRRSFSGGAGLVSTARDYARFAEMLRRGGAIDGVRILAPRTVALMASNQTGTMYTQPGQSFGLGFSIVERFGADGLASVGTYQWAGAYGSTYRIDPVEGLVIVFMINQLPGRTETANRFPTLVYQALVEPRGK